MKEEKLFEVEDRSGDRKYFTQVPNYVLNHSTATAQALYLQLKRLAGDSGLAYPSREYLMKHLHIHHITLKKEFKYLFVTEIQAMQSKIEKRLIANEGNADTSK